MGFHHIYTFILVMLGKQGWKFLSGQDDMVSQVFEAIYYSNEDFFHSRLGH